MGGLPSAEEREKALIKALPELRGYGKEKMRKLIYTVDIPEEARQRVMNDLGMPMTKPVGF